MSITVVTILHCEFDGCKQTTTTHKAAKALPRQLRKEAKKDGWCRVAGRDYCEAHKPTRVTSLTFPQS